MLMRLIYNLVLPVGFLGFLPGMLWKLKHRPGWKATFGERFGRYTPERVKELEGFRGAIWIHAVSVGESMIALSFVKRYLALHPQRRFVISTTTTTGQELVRKALEPFDHRVTAIFCPIDFLRYVRKVFDLVMPSALVILETELWPNMIAEARHRAIPLILANARMSDHSARGYRKFRCFFGPLLNQFDLISAQSEGDKARFLSVAPEVKVVNQGNLKFDQKLPDHFTPLELDAFFGAGKTVIVAASTHPGEENLIADVFGELRKKHPELRLVLVPRHAERGGEIAAMLAAKKISYLQRSQHGECTGEIDCLLADTTGELLRIMAAADLILMGKSFAGQNEGHNLIEPALLGKAVICGRELTNFRFLLDLLRSKDAVMCVSDGELPGAIETLLADPNRRREMGLRGKSAVEENSGATQRTMEAIEQEIAKKEMRS
ncbi:MAG: 3-deoxy-D-manno-octulosonic acid transferase [Victivallaceae bacterium]|nr:3-deoxy-D-manno-octulosonic acid transferase [Victivallaceae bacterium]